MSDFFPQWGAEFNDLADTPLPKLPLSNPPDPV